MAARPEVVCVLGTRPEVIKLAPVISALRAEGTSTHVILSGQHTTLANPFVEGFAIAPDENLAVDQPGADFAAFIDAVSAALAARLAALAPRAVIVQGDTSTAFAGALAASRASVPLVHVEAGLRTHDPRRPYPEEALRTLITHLADLHCAATVANRANLLREGIDDNSIVITGNPVVDAVQAHTAAATSATVTELLTATDGLHRVVLTAHRRENLGARMQDYFDATVAFLRTATDTCLIYPVHPNPRVAAAAQAAFDGVARAHLVAPLDYADFLAVVAAADLVVSDSGGIQEETATLGVPLVVIRELTERPEILDTGLAQLAPDGTALAALYRKIVAQGWPSRNPPSANPFGDGHSGVRIAREVRRFIRPRA